MARIAVGGSLAQRPGYGGHAWALLNYLCGFRQLGHEVLFLDRLAPEMALDATGRPSRRAAERCIRWTADVMAWAQLDDSYCLLVEGDGDGVGLGRAEAIKRLRDSALFLNVMGFIEDAELLEASPRRVFLDIDPGFGQFWRELGLDDPFAGHDAHVTVGERIGEPDCLVPPCGIEWLTTRHPVVCDDWPPVEGGSRFTSVGCWRGPYDALEVGGRRFGLRAHELRKLLPLPRQVEVEIELALEIDPADGADRKALSENGWRLVDPAIAADPPAYRRYIQSSLAELMVAKEIYVGTRGGWFSERSAAYLASGKPVVALDTGFSQSLPTGEGLLAFTDLDGARTAIEAVLSDPRRHSRAAREIAAEHFDARRILARLLERLGVG